MAQQPLTIGIEEEFQIVDAGGELKAHIDRSYPLGQVPEAIGHLVEGHGGGKVAITVAPRSRLVRLD